MSSGRRYAILLCLVAGAAVHGQQPAAPPQHPPSTFRTQTTLVPVDVRVVDASGRPVNDLKQSDFTLIEDGVPQQILQFTHQVLAPYGADTAAKPLEVRRPLGDQIAPQDRRIFLLVLGRGRQVGPVKGVEAALEFVKERLMPQDQVAVLAYNRATVFTSDHATLLGTLQRYWKKHEWIESRLAHYFSGLAAVHAGREIPPFIQKEIDAIFNAPGAIASREVAATAATDARQISDDSRRQRDLIQRAEIAAQRQQAGVGSPFDQSAMDEAAMVADVGFDEYVASSVSTMSDVENLYSGIRYLRWLDGEKHLVFLTPKGLLLPRIENNGSIAAFANDARVAIDVIHTYGLADAPTPMSSARDLSGRVRLPPMPGGGFVQAFQNSGSAHIARLTGGQMTAYLSGEGFFKSLDETTRSQYLLGYSPSNGAWDGKYRRIEVKVNRKGARALYRHGYVARRETMPLDRQQFLMYSRIAGAANVPRDIEDLKLTLSDASVQEAEGTQVLSVTLRIAPGTIRLTPTGDLHVGKVEAVSICGDDRETMIGELWQTLDFKLPPASQERFASDGVAVTLRIPLKGTPRFVKTILYDYTSDLLGTFSLDLRKR